MSWATVLLAYRGSSRSFICSHKIEFSFLNGNLVVPAGPLFIFNSDGDVCASGQRLFNDEQQR
jgi:hypothetical protein